jgi:hypothetical protein
VHLQPDKTLWAAASSLSSHRDAVSSEENTLAALVTSHKHNGFRLVNWISCAPIHDETVNVCRKLCVTGEIAKAFDSIAVPTQER